MGEVKLFLQSARELEVYKKAFPFSLALHKASLEFPQIEQYALANQLRRSSKSICANIAEGFGKQSQSKAEFARFLSMAMGSCSETETWILYAYELGYIVNEDYQQWLSDCGHITSMLIKLRNSLRVN